MLGYRNRTFMIDGEISGNRMCISVESVRPHAFINFINFCARGRGAITVPHQRAYNCVQQVTTRMEAIVHCMAQADPLLDLSGSGVQIPLLPQRQ